MEDNALTCTCPPPYIWESGECRHCIQGKTRQDIMGFGVLERCSKTCPDGYYYSYKESVPPGSKFTTGDGSCKKINPLDVDKIPDDWLLENYARIKDPAYKENPDLALFAGENPTPDEIRKKLKELLDGYAMPDPTQATPTFTWTNAKSWCEAQGYRMAKASDMRGDSKMQIRAAAFVVGYRGCNFSTRCCIWLDSGCDNSGCDTMMCRGLAIDSEIGHWWGGANAWSYNTICIK